MTLVPSHQNGESLPHKLAPFLQALADRKPELEIRILIWNSFPFFALNRVSQRRLLEAYAHPRIHLVLNRGKPLFASFHEKLITIDGQVAYCGGMDLVADRCDTPVHDPRGSPDRPRPGIHDVHAKVEGEAAHALAELVRADWERATREALEPIGSKFLPGSEADSPCAFRDLATAISRTRPAWSGQAEVRECEAMVCQLISEARHYIYIETQYLSAKRLVRALCDRLRESSGPEVIIVSSFKYFGWWEKRTLGALRDRRLEELRAANAHGRLGVFYPEHRHHPDGILIHSKLILVDDTKAFIGSPNLTERSMGLDHECALTFETKSDENQAAIFSLRAKLLAEHLGMTSQDVAERLNKNDSMLEMIQESSTRDRRLLPIAPKTDHGLLEKWLVQRKWADPPRGINWDPARRAWRQIKRLATFAFFGLIVFLITMQAREIDWAQVGTAIRGYQLSTLALAAMMAAAGYGFYISFDLMARVHLRHALRSELTAAIAFVSYAFNLNFGALIGGAGLRFRLYSRYGLSPREIGGVLAFSFVTNWLGYLLLAGLVLTFAVPTEFVEKLLLPPQVLRAVGALLLGAVVLYLALTAFSKRRVWRIRSLQGELPGIALAASQLVASCGSWLMIALILFHLFGTEVSFPIVLATILAAALGGVITHVPAGLGVIEAVFLAALSGRLPPAQIIAAVFAYRAIYYLVPLVLALIVFSALELTAKWSRERPTV